MNDIWMQTLCRESTSSKAWTTSLKTDTKIINSLRSNSMFFVSNTMHSYLRTGWFPAECLHSDIIHAGVLRFISFHLACVKLFCEDMIAGKARASGSRRLCPPPISPRQECVCKIKISVYMKFASLYHGQQLCSCDSASLKRFVKSTWVSNYMLPKEMTLSERKRVMSFLSVFLI